MRSKLVSLVVVLFATVVSAQQPNRPAASKLPPLVYVCPMPGDEAVLEDKPGNCPVCKMTLVPIRLESKWWCPTHQTVVVRDAAGKCPLDGKDLVQVTLSESWTCADKPDAKLLEPGNCADGKPRKISYEIRAHGDHNPKHGGQFFMAEDQWHHIEGTYAAVGALRLHFYDNFTKPMSAKAFSGSAVILDASFKEVASYPLVLSKDGRTMDARIPADRASLPLNAAAKVKFGPAFKEQLFNFPFSKLTVEPIAPAPAAVTTSKSPAATPTSSAPTTARVAAAPATKAASPAGSAVVPVAARPLAASAAATTPAAVPDPQAPLILDSPLAVPPGLADATDESKLPTALPALVAALVSRSNEVGMLVQAGELAQVWLPAMGTKTAALVLDARSSALPERQRAASAAAAREVVRAAWQLDNYGDLGNRQKITEAYQRLAAAVASLKAIYEQ